MCSMHVRKCHLANSLGIMIFVWENKLYVPKYSLHDLLVRKAHGHGLMGHFSISTTLGVLLNSYETRCRKDM